jgi:hypothetical protein
LLSSHATAAMPARSCEAPHLSAIAPSVGHPARSAGAAVPAAHHRTPGTLHLPINGMSSTLPSPSPSPSPYIAQVRSGHQLVARHLTPHPLTGTALVLPREGGPGVRVPITGV